MNLFHFKIGGTVFSSNSLHTKWFSWCLLKILIRNSRRRASVRKGILNFSSMDFFLGEPFKLIYLFLVNGETLIWTSRGAGKLGYVEKWQRQRTNISQWLWQHGEKTQVDVRSGAKLMETFSFFSAADLPQECRTRRSYSLDRIHLYDSYFPFPFQNKYLLLSMSNDFLPRISLRKLFWPEVFVAINLLANDPECNLSRQWHPN